MIVAATGGRRKVGGRCRSRRPTDRHETRHLIPRPRPDGAPAHRTHARTFREGARQVHRIASHRIARPAQPYHMARPGFRPPAVPPVSQSSIHFGNGGSSCRSFVSRCPRCPARTSASRAAPCPAGASGCGVLRRRQSRQRSPVVRSDRCGCGCGSSHGPRPRLPADAIPGACMHDACRAPTLRKEPRRRLDERGNGSVSPQRLTPTPTTPSLRSD